MWSSCSFSYIHIHIVFLKCAESKTTVSAGAHMWQKSKLYYLGLRQVCSIEAWTNLNGFLSLYTQKIETFHLTLLCTSTQVLCVALTSSTEMQRKWSLKSRSSMASGILKTNECLVSYAVRPFKRDWMIL